MNDEKLIWESYQKIYLESSDSNIVYHVSRRSFDDIHPWSHFTPNLDAAKNIINTDKKEGKYEEGSTYYVYKYNMKPNLKFFRSIDIHSPNVPQFGNFGRQNDWGNEIISKFHSLQDDYPEFKKYVTDSVLNELKSKYDNNPETSKLFDLVFNFLNKNPKYIKIPESHGLDSHKAWKPVIEYFIKQLDPNNTKSTQELMSFYRTLPMIINSLQDILIRNISQREKDQFKMWNLWIFEPDSDDIYGNTFEENQINKQEFKRNILTSYYDGVIYRNEIEGGGDSYILFHPKRDLKLISKNTIK